MNITPLLKCRFCSELRDLDLHLHELSLFCELLNHTHKVPEPEFEDEDATTETIAKWLKLASYLTAVNIDTGLFENPEVYYLCEPALEMEESNSRHHTILATSLTRFLYVSNALEECYRFVKYVYDGIPSKKRWKSEAMRARAVLNHFEGRLEKPIYLEHLQGNYARAVKRYMTNFRSSLHEISEPHRLAYGLDHVRNMRNFVAHGRFPIIEDPDYDENKEGLATKHLLIYVLDMSCRIAAISIQMLLSVADTGFKPSDRYYYLANDPDSGELFKQYCTFSYLTNLHVKQKFGINAVDWYKFSS